MYCTNCGAEISEVAQFCKNCGLPTAAKKPAQNRKVIWIVVIISALFVFIVIGGMMAALIIPNTITAIQKAKLKATMVDITAISNAISKYIVDNEIVPTQDGAYDTSSNFYDALSPSYVENLPINDQWGNNFLVYCGTACNGKYGITGSREEDFIVVSLGRDGIMEDWEFDENDPESGIFDLIIMDDFKKDIVMWNGSWIRAVRTSYSSK